MENTHCRRTRQKTKINKCSRIFREEQADPGFDSAPRSLITTVKEAVDNSLDACEEAGILPDILVQVERTGQDYVTVIIEDNGPGIVREQIPKVFAKLLYGSRFHALKQSRGQQGIGISAAVLYAQMTAGRHTKILSKTGSNVPAHYYELMINTGTNEPDILVDEVRDWFALTGPRSNWR